MLAPDGEQREQPLGVADARLGPLELLLHATAPREGPCGNCDGLAPVVVERMLGEPTLHEIDQGRVVERVDRTRGHLHDIGPLVRRRTPCRDRADGRDDEIDGNHVDDAFGNAGELFQQTAPVGEEDRLGHAKPTDPAGKWFGDRGLDDRRSQDRHGHIAACIDQRTLTDGLRERVGVGKAERRRSCAAHGDHAIGDPIGPQRFGLLCEQRGAGRAQLVARRFAELGQTVGRPARRSRRRGERAAPRRPLGASRRRRRTGSRR